MLQLVVKELNSSVFFTSYCSSITSYRNLPNHETQIFLLLFNVTPEKKIGILFHTQTYDLNVRDIW